MTGTDVDEAEPRERLDSQTLLRATAEAGLNVSGRLLETLRAQDLIPRPTRTGYRGRAPIWTYPPGTDRQLITVLWWRQRTKDPDVLRMLVWLDGFSIPAADIRASLIRWAQAITGVLNRALRDHARRRNLDPGSPVAQDDAVDELARTAAAKRKPSLVPRHGRVSASDRGNAIALMIRTFAFGKPVDGDAEQQAQLVERVLGLTPGRRHRIEGEGPWLTGPASDLLDAADIVALPRLLEAARDATDADIETARQTVVAMYRYLPLMVRFMDAVVGKANYLGLAGMQNIDRQPEQVPYLLLLIVGMLRAGWTDNLRDVTAALGAAPDMADGMQRILELPAKTLQANLSSQPPEVREKVSRLINAATDGQLSLAPQPPTS